MSQIPIVDLEDLQSPRQAAASRAADALREGFGEYGLVYIRNHGIETDRLESFYQTFLEVTDRPTEEKQTWGGASIWYQRGWTPPDTERAVAAGGQPDFKECYFAAPEPLDAEAAVQYPQIYASNVWPEGAEQFRDRYMDIGHTLHEIGLQLLRGSARALNLEPYRFEAAVYGGPHVTRALRYLPLSQEQVDAKVLWGEEHTDFNLLTLLPGGRFLDQDSQFCPRPAGDSGLYLRTRATDDEPAGRLLAGKPPEGCIVAQVGQELEILTGGEFLATPHVIKAPEQPGFSRVSMAHFIHLNAREVLTPLAPFRNESTLASYSPPVLAGTYGLKTLVDIGLAPPEALSQLGYRFYDRLDEARAVKK